MTVNHIMYLYRFFFHLLDIQQLTGIYYSLVLVHVLLQECFGVVKTAYVFIIIDKSIIVQSNVI